MNKKLLRGFGLVMTCGIALTLLASCGKKKTTTTKAITTAPKIDPATPAKDGYNILWSDEFNGEKLNETLWHREVREKGWTNHELQEYTNDEKNGFIRDGKFVIKAYEEAVGSGSVTSTYSSCKLRANDEAAFKYGRIEVSAKTPEGLGLWPAIWMMPKVQELYGEWPRCGEIDIMEVLCNETTKAMGTLHYGVPHAEQQGSVTLTGGTTFANSFHTYAIEWEPGQIEWFIDGESYLVVDDWFTSKDGTEEAEYPAPFNQDFCMQINLAVGGDWPGNPEPGAEYIKDAEFEIDYVRIYQKPEYDENVKKPEKNYREPYEGGNYVKPFATDSFVKSGSQEGWYFYKTSGGNAEYEILEDNTIKITTTANGTEDYSVQLLHGVMPVIKGKTYVIEFEMWADDERVVNEVCFDAPNANWSRYWAQSITLDTTEHKKYSYEFTMTQKSDNGARFEFNMGNTESLATIYIANVKITEKTA